MSHAPNRFRTQNLTLHPIINPKPFPFLTFSSSFTFSLLSLLREYSSSNIPPLSCLFLLSQACINQSTTLVKSQHGCHDGTFFEALSLLILYPVVPLDFFPSLPEVIGWSLEFVDSPFVNAKQFLSVLVSGHENQGNFFCSSISS